MADAQLVLDALVLWLEGEMEWRIYPDQMLRPYDLLEKIDELEEIYE